MDNFYPTLATGLMKRPPTSHKAKLTSVLDASAYATLINRDVDERYSLLISSGSIKVFDAFTGAQKTVNAPGGLSYLTSSEPRKDLATITLADHTFIVNKSVKILAGSSVAPSNANIGYISFTYSGSGSRRTMTASVNTGSGVVTANATATYSSGDFTQLSALISEIFNELVAGLGAGWTVTQPFQNIIRIQRAAATPWTLTVSDDYGGSTMKAIKGSVQLFSDLPAQLDDGYVCYVTSKPDDQGSGYYVRFNASSASYIECPKPGLLTSFDPLTMPHKLVREADGTFTFAPFVWEPRKVGDDESNPFPTFVNRSVDDVFLYRNRLGFLADENVCLSVSGSYFNFSIKTAAAVVDTDPLDISVGNTKVSLLKFAVPFNKTLLLFSDQTQFQLSGGDILSPRTVKADPVTEFSSSTMCRPVGAGQELFFVTNRPGHSGVREYYIQQDTLANDAADITAHVPSYIPPGIFKMTSSTSEDCIVLLSESVRNVMYGYKFYWNKDEKAQSAWFRFIMDPSDIILSCDFVGSVAYLMVQRSDGVYLEEMNMQPGEVDSGLSFNSLLDRKVSLTGTYSATTGLTTWTLPWPCSGTMYAVLGSAFTTSKGASILLAQASSNTVTAKGDYTAGQCHIGVAYTSRFRFSEQYVKDTQGNTIAAAKVKLRKMYLSYIDSGYFRVEVTPVARDMNTYTYTGKILGVAGVKLGAPSLSSGQFTFPIMTDARGVLIDIVNDGPLPSTFQGAEWEGEVVVGAQR